MQRFFAMLAVLTMSGSSAWACPMCKTALESNPSNPEPLAYMLSILFMLSMAAAVFGTLVGALVWMVRQEEKMLVPVRVTRR